MIYILGFVLAVILVAIFSRPEMRGCRWRADRTQDRDGRSYWRCVACGAVSFTDDASPPDLCLRG